MMAVTVIVGSGGVRLVWNGSNNFIRNQFGSSFWIST
jgi:hypothetical protein